MRPAIYARVSTPRQARDRKTDQQVRRLEHYAEQKGWVLDGERVYLDEGYSGANLNRPGLDGGRRRGTPGPLVKRAGQVS